MPPYNTIRVRKDGLVFFNPSFWNQKTKQQNANIIRALNFLLETYGYKFTGKWSHLVESNCDFVIKLTRIAD